MAAIPGSLPSSLQIRSRVSRRALRRPQHWTCDGIRGELACDLMPLPACLLRQLDLLTAARLCRVDRLVFISGADADPGSIMSAEAKGRRPARRPTQSKASLLTTLSSSLPFPVHLSCSFMFFDVLWPLPSNLDMTSVFTTPFQAAVYRGAYNRFAPY